MADDGFDFHPPERREAKRFEPPPWEREAFEELERRRAEQKAAEQTAAAELEVAAPTQKVEAAAPDQETPGAKVEVGPPEGDPRLDESEVAEMLAGLSAEEPREYRSLWRVAMASAIVLGAIGAVLISLGDGGDSGRPEDGRRRLDRRLRLVVLRCRLRRRRMVVDGADASTARSALSGRRERDDRHQRDNRTADRDPVGAEELVPRVLDERHRGTGAPRRPRRTQAGAPAHPVRDARVGAHSHPPVQEVRVDRR